MGNKPYILSKMAYQVYLNETNQLDYESEEWIIGGKRRNMLAYRNAWGTAIRRYDPIQFEVGYQEWYKSKILD